MTHGMHVDIVNVVGTSVDGDGFESIQWDADGEQDSAPTPGQSYHPFGAWGRPPDAVVEPSTNGAAGAAAPDPSKSCQCLKLEEGSLTHLLALCHPPTQAILPTPAAGEHITYASSGCFTRHHADGSISLATTDAGGAPTGRTIAFRVRPTERTFFAPWGRESFDQYGFRVSHVGGARLTLGYVSGLPAPLTGGRSTARVQADIVEVSGSAIAIGPSAALRQAVAQAAPLVEILSSIGAALQAINTAMATITTTTPGATAAAASLPVVEQAVAAIGAALVTISTQTTIG